MIVIDPSDLELSPQDRTRLGLLLQQSANTIFAWDINRTYVITQASGQEEIQLKHPIIKRLTKNLEGWRYEVLDLESSFPEGGSCLIKSSLATIKLDDSDLKIKKKPPGQRRVIKVQPASNPDEEQKARREFYLSRHAIHLHCKDPVFWQGNAYMILRRMEGENLIQLINDDLKQIKVFTLRERIELSLSILQAVIDEVHARNLVHRDIKPENLIAEGVKATTIDFGLAKFMDEKGIGEDSGTVMYMAPEIIEYIFKLWRWRDRSRIEPKACPEPVYQTPASDAYAVGRVLGLIWHDSLAKYSQIERCEFRTKVKLYYETAIQNDFSHLFHGIRRLDPQAKEIIRATIKGLCAPNPLKRMTLPDAVKQFNQALACQFPVPAGDETVTETSPRIPLIAQDSPEGSPRSQNQSPREDGSPRRFLRRVKGCRNLRDASGSLSDSIETTHDSEDLKPMSKK